MSATLNHAIEAAIRRAYALGRVDQSIGWAAEELRRMAAADPDLIPEQVMQLYGLEPRRRFRLPDWDEALWALADLWCELQRGVHATPVRQPPASSPYSVLVYALPAREAAATSR